MGLVGHIAPGVPIVLASRAAGHDVLVVTEPSGADLFERFGIPCVTVPHEYDDPDPTIRTDSNRGPVDGLRQSISWVLRAAGAVEQVTSLARDFGADVMLRELAAFGGSIVGELCDIPVASYEWTPPPTAMLAGGIGSEMAALRSQFGLAPDTELASFDRWLRLVLAPAWWGRGVDHLPDTAHFIRPEPPPSEPAPDWLGELRAGRSVYATLGTVFNRTEGVLAAVLDGLASVKDLHVIATVGHDVDPADFGDLSSRVRVERFVPQQAAFDVVDAVVAHGGYGTLMGALTAGLPIVTVPLAAGDNMANAMSVVKCGAGVMIGADERRPDVVAVRTRQVLDDPSYTQRAQAAAADIAALPAPEHAVALLERLATHRMPIVR